MKTYLHAFGMCQSMFCALPSPWQGWDEEARDKMLLFLPLVGLEMGLLWAGLAWLGAFLGIPAAMTALGISLFPFLVTGFLHLDGFLDVTDAVKSCRDLPRRREILKDSHVGAFAVIGCGMVLLAQFVSALSLPQTGRLWLLALLPVVSRCGSALAVTALPPMSTSQYASQHLSKGRCIVLAVMAGAALAVGFWADVRVGLALLGCGAGYALALRRGYRSLEGMNGDIAGYALTLAELAGLAAFALMG